MINLNSNIGTLSSQVFGNFCPSGDLCHFIFCARCLYFLGKCKLLRFSIIQFYVPVPSKQSPRAIFDGQIGTIWIWPLGIPRPSNSQLPLWPLPHQQNALPPQIVHAGPTTRKGRHSGLKILKLPKEETSQNCPKSQVCTQENFNDSKIDYINVKLIPARDCKIRLLNIGPISQRIEIPGSVFKFQLQE